MTDILDDLRDLQKQATTERSHFYVRQCCERAIDEIQLLRMERKAWMLAYKALCEVIKR